MEDNKSLGGCIMYLLLVLFVAAMAGIAIGTII